MNKESLLDYLKQGGIVKKDCWIPPMHLKFNPVSEKYEILTTGHTYNGIRGLYAFETYPDIDSIPYAGTWVKCNEQGKVIK